MSVHTLGNGEALPKLTGAQLSRLLGLSRRRVQQLVEDGTLPPADDGEYSDPHLRAYIEHLRSIGSRK